MASFQLDILRELREAAQLTQEDMARLCGLQGQQRRQTAGAWERGEIIPSPMRRRKFIGYLWDHLGLRADAGRFESVWEILMAEWKWEPISDKEWANFTQMARPRRDNAVDQKLEELAATLSQMQNGISAGNAKSVDPALSTLALPLATLPEAAALPPGSRMPLARNPLFVGRQHELLALAAAFAASSTTAISQVETAAATGLGGIGKTQLASEFVHRYGQFFAGGVFWLSFDSAEAIAGEVAACGGVGGLELRPDFATRPLEEQVRLVQAAWQQPNARLLVFDNCEDPALLSRWRPTSGGCRILVTSRCLEWDLALGVQLHALDVLSREESLQLLLKHKLNATLEVLDAIAAELGDLPLALHLAGSYLYRYRRVLTAEQYLAYLRDPALLNHPSLQGAGASPTGHVQHVARTFALSYDRLDSSYQLDARARQILVHLALLAPGEPVPYDLMAQTLDIDVNDPLQAVAMEEAVVRLLELGLVDVHDERQLRVHRLVATYVRTSAPDLWQQAQLQVEATIQERLDDYYQAVTPLPLLPIQSHLRHVVEAALPRADAASATLSHALARYLYGLGEYAEAIQYTERGLAIRQKLYGRLHADVAVSHHLLGISFHESGNFERAHEHLQQALAIRLKVSGEYHFETANILVNIGSLLWSEQRTSEAVARLERALVICDEVVGEDDPLVAEITMTLGLCLLDGGYDTRQARHYVEESLRIRRLQLGEEHPYTALSYTNLGYLLHEIGELEEAGLCYQQGLMIRQRVLGEKHGSTANSLYCLGRLRRMQERWDEALNYLEQSLKIHLENGDDETIPVASCFNELGAALLGKGKVASARKLIERALTIRQKIYQHGHRYIADTQQNLAMVLLAQGELTAAEELCGEVLSVRQQARDPENIDAAETLFALGQVAERRQKLTEAQQHYTRSLTIYRRHLGAENPFTQKVAGALARLGRETYP